MTNKTERKQRKGASEKTGAIGVYDSGVGGLTVLYELTVAFPGERFIYLGDNGNAPYGNRASGDLARLAVKNITRLIKNGACAVVLACNTLSSNLLPQLQEIFPVRIFGVNPAHAAENADKNAVMLCTPKTADALKNRVGVTLCPVPDLAEDVEKSVFDLSKIDIRRHLKSDLSSFAQIILGCTHYVFVREEISKLCPNAKISDCNEKLIADLQSFLAKDRDCVLKGRRVKFIGNFRKKNRKTFEIYEFEHKI